jgi:hypothetical protein
MTVELEVEWKQLQAEWIALRDDPTMQTEPALLVRLGLELVQERLDDPYYQAAVKHAELVEQYKAERTEKRRLLTLRVGDRLVHAHEQGETSVLLSPKQTSELVAMGCGRHNDVGLPSVASYVNADTLPSLGGVTLTWELTSRSDWWTLVTFVEAW